VSVVKVVDDAWLAEVGIDRDVYSAMKNSLYPGAKDESIKMVVAYCRAAKLDPLQKPVHIVPMSVKDAVTSQYAFRDVIMPGIGLYRIQAERSGSYAGVGEPEFGPDVTEMLGGISVTYPKYCKVVVKKIVQGQICEFTGIEFWKENYASKGKDSTAPNAMWAKRPKGQLAKCAEAQALRKGWPEIGQQPTAEEMEGKSFDIDGPEEPAISAASSRVASQKERIKQKQMEAQKPPTQLLSEVLEKIDLSESKKELDSVAVMADGLSEDEKIVARKAFKEKSLEATKEPS
jgi:phage recombination protein Bet